MITANPKDIIVVGSMAESSAWPEFDRYQVFTVTALDRSIRGRRFRHAYVTDMAMWNVNGASLSALHSEAGVSGGEIRNAKDWRPDVEPTVWQRVGKAILRLAARFA